jgi:two-component system, sensor histidine kinase and response regulator
MTKILLIEDEQALRKEMAEVLRFENFEIVEAGNGEVAIYLAHMQLPDLIICDITMPGMDGYEVLVKVRSTPEMAQVPFIFVTAHADRSFMRHGMELGADDYLTKPFTRTELLKAINARMKRQSAPLDVDLNEAKRHLTRMVTHELRTPLTLVKMAQEIIDRQIDTLSPQAIREYLDLVRSGNQRLSHVVDQIVYVTSLETKVLCRASIQQTGKAVALGDLVMASIDLAHQLDHRHRNITIRNDVRDPQALVETDVFSLKHALAELLVNAINFSPEQGHVMVSQWLADDSIWINILDEGPGISGTDIKRAFKPFEQIDRERHDQQGMGLGLPLAQQIVQAHGGTLELTAVVGKGTQVLIKLPRVAGNIAKSDTNYRSEQGGPMVSHIMVIEDEQSLREEVVAILGFEGFEVLSAPNGKIGLKLIREHLPDMILSDIVMPIYDGYRVLLEVRSDPATAAIPFVFLTAKGERRDWRYGMEMGADDYLTKPFTRDELVGAVRSNFERRAAIEKQNDQKIDELRSAITHALPHELRTPLTSILGFGSLLMEMPTCDLDEVHELSGYIVKSTERLHRVIENVLLSAQISLINTDVERVAALRKQMLDDPASVIRDAAFLKAKSLKREHDLVLELSALPIHTTEDSLRKIVEELTDNAIKFSAPGTSILITLKASNHALFLTVENEGRGIQPDQIQRIGDYLQFERTRYEQQGLGLGLSIASRLASLHGGSLTISSVPGQITTIVVMLPLADVLLTTA